MTWRSPSKGNPAWITVVAVVAVLATGCQALNAPLRDAQQRRKRNEQTVRQFDEKRDAAEMLAAREQYAEGDLTEARERAERILTRNPKHHEAQALLAEVKEVEKEFDQEQRVVAAGWVAKAGPSSATAPGRKPAAGAERTGHAQKKGDDEGAESSGPGRASTLLESAEAAIRDKSPKAAETAVARIEEARAASPHNPQIPLSGAAILLRANRPEAACKLLGDASAEYPDSAAIHRMLGTAYYRAGDYKSSQVAFQQALSLDKSSALSYFLMGCTLAKLGQADAAAAHFRQAELLDPRYGAER